ncbi:hypothetical protein E4T56_gene3022 [Termitomyces sp. T112]|nr:hypothetical protein E4T56_gene3022 [Termitomyces sp. T112]KAH0583898.1 hypothetical protein H2248_009491 [Termitomyces sp. 'cryptogamus']
MVFKKYQCRYFHSDGRSKVPSCSQGSHCRFLHPDDAGWPGLKPKPQEKRVTPSSSSSHKDAYSRYSLPNKPQAPISPPRRFESRAAPLISQDDLFLRKKLSEDDPTFVPHSQTRRQSLGFSDDYRDRGRDNKQSKDDVSRNDSRSRSQRPYDHFSYLGAKKPTASAHSSNATTQKGRVVSGTKRKLSDDLDSSGFMSKLDWQLEDRHRTSPRPHDTSGAKSYAISISTESFASGIRPEVGHPTQIDWRQEEVVSLFRELSRLVCQATEDTIAQARDDKKLKAYTDLSSMLSKISSKVPTAITPTLTDILLRHAQGKQRIEDNLKATLGVWNKAFDVFVSDISRAVDSMLAGAVKRITEAADLASKSVLSQASTPAEKEQSSASETSGKSCQDQGRDRSSEFRVLKGGDVDSRRDPKRRRVSNIFPSSDTMHTPVVKPIVEQSMHEILSQMKSKIDEQAQSLQKLMKENNELKASLQRQSGVALCVSSPAY